MTLTTKIWLMLGRNKGILMLVFVTVWLLLRYVVFSSGKKTFRNRVDQLPSADSRPKQVTIFPH
ncbi:hypothetical protein Hanom_Chr09g00759871 [Helianthus anomalus]